MKTFIISVMLIAVAALSFGESWDFWDSDDPWDSDSYLDTWDSGITTEPETEYIFIPKGGSTTIIGSSQFHSDGTSTQRIGDTYFHSDGTSSTKIGDSLFRSDGSYSFGSTGTTSNIGDTYFDNSFDYDYDW